MYDFLCLRMECIFPIISCITRLILDLLIAVVFGGFSPFEKGSHKPSGIKSPTVVTHAKIPHASHMTRAIFHHVTLY